MTFEDALREAALLSGMTEEEARRAAQDALRRQEWRLRRGRKECPACRTEKPVWEFGRDSSRRDGLEVRCRECRRVNGGSATTQADF